jgi:chemotaxis protein methyltransferase CheR
MVPDDFEYAARLIKERSGLVLTRDKGYLLENRLMPVVRQHNFKSFHELVAALRTGDATLQSSAVDAMMAKDTAFFRDWKPFVHFAKIVLPNLMQARREKRHFRILCAGVSTGQEAYSIAMLIRDAAAQLTGWRAEIVGVDLSASAIAAAEAGHYTQFDVQRGLPIKALLRSFTRDDGGWQLNGDIRSRVNFQTWNLLDDIFPLGRFDVVLCRNVMVYLDLQAKIDLLQKLSRSLADDGVLYLGTQEPLMGVSAAFRPVNRDLGIYAVHRLDKLVLNSLALPQKSKS